MPTYEYECPEGHAFELFQKMSDAPEARCAVCGLPATRRISGGAGLVFKGSGFYITDYGKDGKGPRTAPPEGGDKGEKAAGKPDTRSGDKPEGRSKAEGDAKPKAEKPAAAPPPKGGKATE